jgi:hypothetical protein
MDVITVFIAEVCLALLLSRTLVAHLRTFLRRIGNTSSKPRPPRTAAPGRQAAASPIPESNVAQP